MSEKILFDWPFKIIKSWEAWWLTFAKIVFNWNDTIIRFKPNNLESVIICIQRRYWRQGKLSNPITWLKEELPLKQYLKNNNENLFYR